MVFNLNFNCVIFSFQYIIQYIILYIRAARASPMCGCDMASDKRELSF